MTETTPDPQAKVGERGGQRIYHYEVVQWLRHNGDIARSGGTVDLTTGPHRQARHRGAPAVNPLIAALCLIGLACGAFVSVVGQGNLLTFAYVAASGFVLGGQVAQRRRGESR